MSNTLLHSVKRSLARLLGKAPEPSGVGRTPAEKGAVDELYEKNDYIEAYRRHTDLRVDEDPKAAIGGMWEEIGRLQFDFLVGRGLEPGHRMLDIGCGTLRGGRHFIRHLDPGNYHGIDISARVIEEANRLVADEGLSEKHPRLILSERCDLTFREFPGETFDFILAQSVFTHLKPEHITECFDNVGKVMHDGSTFYFTYVGADEFVQTTVKDFRYPFSFFEGLAGPRGFVLEECAKDYPHPRNQLMVALRKAR